MTYLIEWLLSDAARMVSVLDTLSSVYEIHVSHWVRFGVRLPCITVDSLPRLIDNSLELNLMNLNFSCVPFPELLLMSALPISPGNRGQIAGEVAASNYTWQFQWQFKRGRTQRLAFPRSSPD